MRKLAYPDNKTIPYIIIVLTYAFYVLIFGLFHHQLGVGLGAVATIPVMGASWYFGMKGGVLTAILSVLANVAFLLSESHANEVLLSSPGSSIGVLVLILIGLVVGYLGTVTRQRSEAILKLQQYEREHQLHARFLEQLNAATGRALETDSLDSTLRILGEGIADLFQADDCFFSLWDEAKQVPVPVAAYGVREDIYPDMLFPPGENTLSASVMELQDPIAVSNVKNSPYIGPGVAAILPSCSMLGLPLVAQHRKLGALLLGYRKPRSFTESDLARARMTAEQVALVLSKSLLLEEERKQVRQLSTLHDIALIAVEVDHEDELVHRVTDVIGQNFFPDSFGILWLDEQAEVLHTHPSYRFFSPEERSVQDIPLTEGIPGLVVRTGRVQRIGQLQQMEKAFGVNEGAVSVICVPLKFKEHILGVINAESAKKDAFTEEDERLLITLAGQIATAIEQIRKAQAERKWLDQLAHSNDLIYALAQITTHIEKAFSIDDIIRNLGVELDKIDLTCIMAVYDKERGLFTVNYTSLEPQFLERIEDSLGYPLIRFSFSRDRLKLGNSLYPTVLANLEEEIQLLFPQARRQAISELLKKIEAGPNTQPLRLPLVFEDNLLGILWIWGKDLSKADLPILSIFAKQVGVSLERARLFQEVQSLALTDPLTGLQNRRSLFELGRLEFARATRMNRPFSCMMLDLDHFKQINDTYGHPVGDQVLREFANRCKLLVREVDLLGRYGGEELLILMPETDRNTAIQVAERLRAGVAATPTRILDKEIAVTVSIGVATEDENTTQLETLIARADQAMYIAKHRGRNQVAVSR
jgi:diguanylate cyclase (GGDEF)-like protein